MKPDESKVDPNFHNDKIPKEDRWSLYFFISNIAYVLKRSANYYSQVFLEAWKYFVKEKKVRKYWRKGKKRSLIKNCFDFAAVMEFSKCWKF